MLVTEIDRNERLGKFDSVEDVSIGRGIFLILWVETYVSNFAFSVSITSVQS
jgi:hypothetical protein